MTPPGPSSPVATTRFALADVARWVVVATLVALLLVGVAVMLWQGVHVLMQAFAGLLLAVFLGTISRWLSDYTDLSYRKALVVVTITLLFLTAGMFYLLANRLAVQFHQLQATVPVSVEQIRTYLSESAWGQLVLEQVPKATETAQNEGMARVFGFLSGVTNMLVTVVVVIFVGIFVAADPEMYRAGLLHLIPPAHRPRTADALDAAVFNLRWWLVGQLALMVMMWVTTTVGLWLLGIPLALTLGLIAGVLELIPYVGPWISAVPAVLVALMVSPGHVLAVLALYLVLHILEGYLALPLVQSRAVHLPPALTLVTQVLLGDLLGVLGLFVAAPLTVVAVVVMKMLYVEDTLGDQNVEVPGEPGKDKEAEPAAERRELQRQA